MRGFRADGTARFSDGEPLDAMCDNVLASNLGGVYRHAQAGKFHPDSIDAGLELLRLLTLAGFEVRERQ